MTGGYDLKQGIINQEELNNLSSQFYDLVLRPYEGAMDPKSDVDWDALAMGWLIGKGVRPMIASSPGIVNFIMEYCSKRKTQERLTLVGMNSLSFAQDEHSQVLDWAGY